jgi:hypothetical protein
MDLNGESIYGPQSSPFPSLDFGRCTQKNIGKNRNVLYFHVFDWPADGILTIPGIYNRVNRAYLLSERGKRLRVTQSRGQTRISVPTQAPDAHASVIAVEISGEPDIALPPAIMAATPIFINNLDINVSTGRPRVSLHYSLDGAEPSNTHPIVSDGRVSIDQTSTVKVRAFRGKTPVSPVSEATFRKVAPKAPVRLDNLTGGLNWEYFEGEFKSCAEMSSPIDSGSSANITLSPAKRAEHYGLRFSGYIEVPSTAVFTFFTASDDGSRLWIGDELVVNNDGHHGTETVSGVIALERGLHPIRVEYIQGTGSAELQVHWQGPGVPKRLIRDNSLMRDATQ